LTVIAQDSARMSSLARVGVVEPGRKLRIVWQCPEHTWCGTLTAVAWSPDGRRLALTLSEIGGRSGYVGLHVIDLARGRDRQIGAPAIPHLVREQPTSVLQRVVDGQRHALGCSLPHELAWSPNSKRLAYVCGDDLLEGGAKTRTYIIRPDGTGRTRLRTGTSTAYWPTWSPDGSRIAFATQPSPRITYRFSTTIPVQHRRSTVYTIHLDGSSRTLVARDVSAPAWSPDGKTIAVAALCGVERLTVAGSPVGNCLPVHGRGLPAWSPDGTELALTTETGTEVVGVEGGAPTRVTAANGQGVYGVGRPAWAPASALSLLFSQRHPSGV
jgi:Tol biopolymer transport system component